MKRPVDFATKVVAPSTDSVLVAVNIYEKQLMVEFGLNPDENGKCPTPVRRLPILPGMLDFSDHKKVKEDVVNTLLQLMPEWYPELLGKKVGFEIRIMPPEWDAPEFAQGHWGRYQA